MPVPELVARLRRRSSRSRSLREPSHLDRLVRALAEGERSAFPEAFRLLWPPLLRLCQRMLRNRSDAEDAAQQAMEKVLTRASEYDPEKPALPWALAIASWECRTIRTRQRRRREVPEPESSALDAELLDAEAPHVQRELEAAAVHAMGELSPGDREVLLATFWSEAAGVSGATLRKRRERALARLRRAFARLYGLD